jgi:hypothetical protein
MRRFSPILFALAIALAGAATLTLTGTDEATHYSANPRYASHDDSRNEASTVPARH